MNKLTLEQYSNKIAIPVCELKGVSRVPEIALARQVYWFYLYSKGIILKDIASQFNRNAHSTIISGISTIKNMIDTKNNSIDLYMNAIGYPFDSFSHQDPTN